MRQTLGVAAILLYSAHAVVLIHRGEAHDLLWGCHVAVLFVGAGLLASSARLNSIGLLWSCFGMPLWVLYAFTGGEVLATSALTHIAAFVIGTYGVRLLGIPRASAWAALGAFLTLWVITRAATPAAANVNLAFSVHPGWERVFPAYPIYFVALFTGAAMTFATAEYAFRRIAQRAGPAASARAGAVSAAASAGPRV